MDLKKVRAIVSGGAGGLGKEFTLRLLNAGAHVCAGDVNTAGLRALKHEAAEAAECLFLEQLDVTDEANVKTFTERAGHALVETNLLINCAGIIRDSYLVTRTEGEVRTMSTAQWKRVLDVNLSGSFYLTRAVAALMVAQGTPGVIINISSLCHSGNAGQSNYSASKAAINAAGRSWAIELAPHGIRVGTIAPGVIATPLLDGISEEAQARMRNAIPLGHIGSPQDVWRAVQFIIECDFFTGRVIEVDGGASLAATA